jgi:FixJ family two-component response regulator
MHFVMANVKRQIVVALGDDRRVRESMESLIGSDGYAPVMFSSGEEFPRSGTLAAASCVIADVRMPGMDGIEVQRRIRLERPKSPVIFISGRQSAETRQRALDEGAVEFLYKPLDALGLLEVFRRLSHQCSGEIGNAFRAQSSKE